MADVCVLVDSDFGYLWPVRIAVALEVLNDLPSNIRLRPRRLRCKNGMIIYSFLVRIKNVLFGERTNMSVGTPEAVPDLTSLRKMMRRRIGTRSHTTSSIQGRHDHVRSTAEGISLRQSLGVFIQVFRSSSRLRQLVIHKIRNFIPNRAYNFCMATISVD